MPNWIPGQWYRVSGWLYAGEYSHGSWRSKPDLVSCFYPADDELMQLVSGNELSLSLTFIDGDAVLWLCSLGDPDTVVREAVSENLVEAYRATVLPGDHLS